MFTACAPVPNTSPQSLIAKSKNDASYTLGPTDKRGYTIVLPANVRFCGVDMQLDLKIDQKTLAEASNVSKKAVQDAVQSRSRRAPAMAVAAPEPIIASTSSAYGGDVEASAPLTNGFAIGSEQPSQSSDSIAQPCTSTTMSSPSGSTNGSHHPNNHQLHDNIRPSSSKSSSSSSQPNLSQQSSNDLAQKSVPAVSEPSAGTSTPPKKKRRNKDQAASVFCCFQDDNAKCKQRAILKYQYCIRHILLDVTAPYKRCQHERKPKSKKDPPVKCTNAIHISKPEDYCSTHLIMLGRKEPKKKHSKEENGVPPPETPSTEAVESPACPTPSTGEIYPATHDPYADHMFDGESSCSSTTNSMQWQSPSVAQAQPASLPPQTPVVMQQHRFDMQPMSVDNSGYPQQSPMSFDSEVTVGQFVSSQMVQMQQQPIHHQQAPQPQQQLPQQQIPQQQQIQQQQMQMPVQQHQVQPHHQPVQQHVQPQQVHHQQVHHQRSAPPPTPNHQIQVPYDQHSQQQMQPPPTPNKITSPLQVGTMSNGNSAAQSPFHSPYPAPLSSTETVGHFVQRQLPLLQQQQHIQQQQQQIHQQPLAPAPMLRQTHYPQHSQQQQYQQPQQPVGQPPPQQVQVQQVHHQPPPQKLQQHQFVQPAPPPINRRQSVQQNTVQVQQKQVVSRTPTVSSLLSRPQNPLPQHQQAPLPRQYRQVVVQQPVPPGKMIVTASAATLPSSAPIGIMERPPTIDPKNTVMPKYTAEEAEAKLKPEEEDDSFLDAYLQNDEKRPPKKKMILKPKRYRTKMIGSYRNVPCVDNMCKMFEDSDFDKTDLFPLGLEPSDDEDSYSDDDFFNISGDWCRRMSHDGNQTPSTSSALLPTTELYMLKKQLRLERHRLLRLARINAPILMASKTHANSAGAALRHRSMRIREQPYNVSKTSGLACVFMVQNGNADGTAKRCMEVALPRSCFCRDHVCESSDQHLFQPCENRCGKTLSMVEVITFDKLCIRCHREKELKEKEEAAAAEAAAANAAIAAHRMHEHVHSVHSSASSMMLVDGSLPNPSEAVYSDVLMGIHDSDANDDGVLDSVVRDFGLDDRDLSDMLAQMPVEVDDDMGDLGHDYMDSMHHGAHDSLTSGLTMNHDWCDVEEFLDAEGWKSDLGSL